jgi:hypothetical protein
VVDRDDRKPRAVALNRNLDCGLVKSGVDVIDGNGVVWVGGVT